MLIFRLVFGLLLLAGLFCFGSYIATRDPRWRYRGVVLVKWTVLAGLGFFVVVFLERLARIL
ncbi:MAG: hypothetical protein U5L74_08400 [Ideonella sp.]|nr:hypothetical protein [Ideonella sp.]